MRIQGPAPALTLSANHGPDSPVLRPGTILEARVVASEDGRITLALSDGRRLEARSERPLAPGTPLRLQVSREADRWLLHPLPEGEARLHQALRESLPRAQGWSALLPLLQHLAKGDPLTRLLAALPPRSDLLDPAALRRAIARAGLQLERRLAAGEADPDDLKLRLLSLLDGGERTHETVEALLHHLRQRQLQHLQDPTALWITLPYREPDGRPRALELRWRRRRKGGQQVDTLLLSLETERLGPCHAHLRWDGRLGLDLWAERPATLALLEEHATTLTARLREAGIDCAHLHCHLGRPPELDEARPATPLLDLRA